MPIPALIIFASTTEAIVDNTKAIPSGTLSKP